MLLKIADELRSSFPTFVVDLDDEYVDYLGACLDERKVAAGTRLATEGLPARELVLLREGSLRLDVGPDLPLGEKGAGEWCGALGAIDPGPSPATVDAATDAHVLVMRQRGCESLRHEPEAFGRLLMTLARDVALCIRAAVEAASRPDERSAALIPAALARLHGIPRSREATSCDQRVTPRAHDRIAAESRFRFRLRRFLEKVDPLRPLHPKLLALLDRGAQLVSYEAGDVVLDEGETGDGLFLILEGRVEVTLRRQRLPFVHEQVLGPGAIFGEIAFLDGRPCGTTFSALTPVVLAVWSPSTVEGLLRLGTGGDAAAMPFLHLVARRVVRDARYLHRRLAEAWQASATSRPVSR